MDKLAELLLHVAAIFDSVGARYAYVGSVASSTYGSPRSTNDVDLITDLSVHQVADFVRVLGDDFYFDENAVRRALEAHRSFNLIHQDSMFKVDVFHLPPVGFGQTCLARSSLEPAMPDSGKHVFMITAEDVLLSKLESFENGGGTSERQWLDVLGVIREQGTRLDMSYMREWASRLSVADLLERALADA